jgi:hypothetical protein
MAIIADRTSEPAADMAFQPKVCRPVELLSDPEPFRRYPTRVPAGTRVGRLGWGE